MNLHHAQRRMVLTEMAVSAAINGIVPPAIIWALRAPAPLTVLGADGLITKMLPATILPVLAITIILTLVVRGRAAKGRAPWLDLAQPGAFGLSRAPASLVLRAVLFTALAMLVLLPVGLGAAAALHATPMTRGGFAVFNVLYGIFTGVVIAPLVVLRALADRPKTLAARA